MCIVGVGANNVTAVADGGKISHLESTWGTVQRGEPLKACYLCRLTYTAVVWLCFLDIPDRSPMCVLAHISKCRSRKGRRMYVATATPVTPSGATDNIRAHFVSSKTAAHACSYAHTYQEHTLMPPHNERGKSRKSIALETDC